jgi:acetyl esterase/lipase
MFQEKPYWKHLFSRSTAIALLNLLIVFRLALSPALAQSEASPHQGQAALAKLQQQVEARPSSKRAVLPGIQYYGDVFYSPEKESSRSLDLYLPEGVPNYKLPIVILIHGGGWQGGDKKDFAKVAQNFVDRGFAAASINYRLSKEAIWPAQAIDCKQAVKWLRAHAEKFHLDPERFAVGGHSAGGHLSAFLAASNGVKKFDPQDMVDISSDVQAELWFAGVADLITRATTKGYESEQSPNSGESRLVGGPVLQKHAVAADASPVTWVSARSAPFYFEAGSDDKIVPPQQVDEMRLALEKFDIDSESHILEGVGHGGAQFFDREHLFLIVNFLKRTLKLDDRFIYSPINNAAYTIRPFSAPDLVLSAGGKIVDPQPRIYLDNYHGTMDERWTFSRRGSLYAIQPSNDLSVALTVLNGMQENKSPVVLSRNLGRPEQLWRIVHTTIGDAYYLIPSHAPNSALDDFGGSKIPGSFVDIFQLDMNDEHEKWTLQLPEQANESRHD